MYFIIIGVIILLIVLASWLFTPILGWAFNNPIAFAVLLIIIGGLKILLDNILYEQDKNDEYIIKENGRKKFKTWDEMLSGFAVALFLGGGMIWLIFWK